MITLISHFLMEIPIFLSRIQKKQKILSQICYHVVRGKGTHVNLAL